MGMVCMVEMVRGLSRVWWRFVVLGCREWCVGLVSGIW